MNTQFLSVGRGVAYEGHRPRIRLSASWLLDMGFTPGALVQALPEPNGIVFTLCDENIGRYSELARSTDEKNGKLLQVITGCNKSHPSPAIVTTGQYILYGGLSIGDHLIVRCTHGLIRMRKFSDIAGNAKTISVVSRKDKHTGGRIPKVRISGEWMAEAGFTPLALVTAESKPGSITLALRDQEIEKYSELVKYTRANKLKLLQVRQEARGPVPYIEMAGSCVEKAGFATDDVLMVHYEYGLIKLQKLDFEQLGF